jgi:hypothetical protein
MILFVIGEPTVREGVRRELADLECRGSSTTVGWLPSTR